MIYCLIHPLNREKQQSNDQNRKYTQEGYPNVHQCTHMYTHTHIFSSRICFCSELGVCVEQNSHRKGSASQIPEPGGNLEITVPFWPRVSIISLSLLPDLWAWWSVVISTVIDQSDWCIDNTNSRSDFTSKGPAHSFGLAENFRKEFMIKTFFGGLPWWHSGWESACQCRGYGFEPWSGKIPHATEQLSPCATTTEAAL